MNHMKNKFLHLAAVLLAIILILLGIDLYRQYSRLDYIQSVRTERIRLADLRRHRHLSAADASYIRPWMTFDYVASAYEVPADYLKSKLGISDSSYPHVSIARYAKINSLDENALNSEVIGVVRGYLNMNAAAN
jgi:hypothetical protein